MQVSKERICKCGHLKDEHKNKPESRLSSAGQCKKCPCSDYLNRKLPNKFSIFSLGIGLFIIGFCVINSFIVYSIGIDVWNKPVNMNTGSLVIIAVAMFALLSLIISQSSLFDYFSEKKRKEWPIE